MAAAWASMVHFTSPITHRQQGPLKDEMDLLKSEEMSGLQL